MAKQKLEYKSPNDRWGWIIVMASALTSIALIPIVQGFGMVYGHTFNVMGISATQSTIILNCNQAFGMLSGLMNGYLMKTFGYRKMAVFGSVLFSTGIMCTSLATKFGHFLITYGMMASLGMVITLSANSIALNAYFPDKKKKARATGMTMTINGLGPILMPQLTSLLLLTYDSQGTMLILGALSLHALVAAVLLQPIKWHAQPVEAKSDILEEIKGKEEVTEESETLLTGSTEKSINEVDIENRKFVRRISSIDYNGDNTSMYGFETPMQNGSLLDLLDRNPKNDDSDLRHDEDIRPSQQLRKLSLGNFEFDYKRSCSQIENRGRRFSFSAAKYGDLGFKKNIIPESPEEDTVEVEQINDKVENSKPTVSSGKEDASSLTKTKNEKVKDVESEEPKSLLTRFLTAIVNIFDLDLLRDPIYVNIMLGMSIAIFAEINFSILTPFILSDMYLDTKHIAAMMSTMSSVDLILRAAAPFIREWLKQSTRVMYICSLVLLIFSRSALLLVNGFPSLMAVAVILGISKGLRTVYMTLVIPEYVSIKKLASASGIQSFVNGLFLLFGGSLIGVIRDLTGSYKYCIVYINSVTAVTIVIWLVEFAIVRWRRLKNSNETSNDESSQEIQLSNLEQDVESR